MPAFDPRVPLRLQTVDLGSLEGVAGGQAVGCRAGIRREMAALTQEERTRPATYPYPWDAAMTLFKAGACIRGTLGVRPGGLLYGR